MFDLTILIAQTNVPTKNMDMAQATSNAKNFSRAKRSLSTDVANILDTVIEFLGKQPATLTAFNLDTIVKYCKILGSYIDKLHSLGIDREIGCDTPHHGDVYSSSDAPATIAKRDAIKDIIKNYVNVVSPKPKMSSKSLNAVIEAKSIVVSEKLHSRSIKDLIFEFVSILANAMKCKLTSSSMIKYLHTICDDALSVLKSEESLLSLKDCGMVAVECIVDCNNGGYSDGTGVDSITENDLELAVPPPLPSLPPPSLPPANIIPQCTSDEVVEEEDNTIHHPEECHSECPNSSECSNASLSYQPSSSESVDPQPEDYNAEVIKIYEGLVLGDSFDKLLPSIQEKMKNSKMTIVILN